MEWKMSNENSLLTQNNFKKKKKQTSIIHLEVAKGLHYNALTLRHLLFFLFFFLMYTFVYGESAIY